jgi:hypothetical protein
MAALEISIVIISVYKNIIHRYSGIWVGYKPRVLRDAYAILLLSSGKLILYSTAAGHA